MMPLYRSKNLLLDCAFMPTVLKAEEQGIGGGQKGAVRDNVSALRGHLSTTSEFVIKERSPIP
jgi:hypothetical protein